MRAFTLLTLCLLALISTTAVGKPAGPKCRGIIAKKHAIVTTAACVKGLRLSDVNVWANNRRQQVQEVIGHPRYLNSSKRSYDVAVLKLAKPQPTSNRKLRAKIANNMPKSDIKSYVLDCEGKAVPVTILSKKTCDAQKGGSTPLDVICAYRRKIEEKRECQPLRGSALVSGPYLVGIFTGAKEPQRPLRKDGGYVLMHTSVIGHRKWIRKMLAAIEQEGSTPGMGRKQLEPPQDQPGVSSRINNLGAEDMADEASGNQSPTSPTTVFITKTEASEEPPTVTETESTTEAATEAATNATATQTDNTSSDRVEITRRFQSEGTSEVATDEETSKTEPSSSETFAPSSLLTTSSEEMPMSSTFSDSPSTLYTSSSEEISLKYGANSAMETRGKQGATQDMETSIEMESSETEAQTSSTGAASTWATGGSTQNVRTEPDKISTAYTALPCARQPLSTTTVESDNDDEEEIDTESVDDKYEDDDDDEGDGEEDGEEDQEEDGEKEEEEEDNGEEGSLESDQNEEDDEEDTEDSDEDEDDEPDDDEDEESESSEEYSSEEQDIKNEREVILMAASGRNLRKMKHGSIKMERQRDGTLILNFPKTVKRGSAVVVLGKH